MSQDENHNDQKPQLSAHEMRAIKRRKFLKDLAIVGTGFTGVGKVISEAPVGIVDAVGKSGNPTMYPPDTLEDIYNLGSSSTAAGLSAIALSIKQDTEKGNERRTVLKLATAGAAMYAGGEVGHNIGSDMQKSWTATIPPKTSTTTPPAQLPATEIDKSRSRDGRGRD